MKRIVILVLALLLVSPTVLAEKPDPNVPNPPLQVLEHNVDGMGWIAVHEQGTDSVDIIEGEELDVSITNTELDVNVTNPKLTVDVDNFPATQDVNVTGGVIDALIPPASSVALPNFPGLDAGETVTVDFPTVLATTIVIWDNSLSGEGDPEFQMEVRSPLNGGASIFQFSYDESLYGTDIRSFTHPIPVSGIEIWCKNESLRCTVNVAVIGF